jgi:hypothetical protein
VRFVSIAYPIQCSRSYDDDERSVTIPGSDTGRASHTKPSVGLGSSLDSFRNISCAGTGGVSVVAARPPPLPHLGLVVFGGLEREAEAQLFHLTSA